MFRKPSSSFWWCAAVGMLVLGFTCMTSSARLRRVWQLGDAGTTLADRPAGDLAAILIGIDCYRQAGFHFDESLIKQAAARENEPFYDYPGIWLALAHVPGINARHAQLIAVILYVLFGLTLGILFRKEPVLTQVLVFFALLSPCIFLLCERANLDLLLFCLVSWAALLVVRSRMAGEIAATGLLLAAAILKLYPIAASVCLFSNSSRRRKVLFAICIIFFSLAILVQRSDVARVAADVPQPTNDAYGSRVLAYEILGFKIGRQRNAKAFNQFRDQLRKRSDYDQLVAVSGSGAELCALLFACGFGLLGMRTSALLEKAATLTPRHTTLFLAGASTYVATFIADNNYCYRLVYLILCIPALAALARVSDAKPVRWLFGSLVGAVLVVLWITPIFEPLEYFLIHNLLHWLIVCGLSFVAGGVVGASLLWTPLPLGQNRRTGNQVPAPATRATLPVGQ